MNTDKTVVPSSPARQAVAAFGASTLNVAALMPLDTLTRAMQAQGSSSYSGTLKALTLDPHTGQRHVTHLYRGMGLAVAEAGIGRAMLFGGVAGIKRYLPSEWSETTKEASGAFVFAAARGVITAPIDKIKTMRQVTAHHGKAGTLHTFLHVVQNDSVLGFWRGMSTDLLRNSIRLPLFMGLRAKLNEEAHAHGIDTRLGKSLTHIGVGALAGVSSELASYPWFTVKVWMQKAETSHQVPKGPFVNLQMLKTIAAEHGIRGWYAGAAGRSGGYFVGAALFNLSFEYFKELLTSV
jgi:hypothetical protein